MPLVDIADYVDGFTELKALCGYGFHKTHDPVVSGMFGLAEQQPVSYPLALNGLGCGGDCACAKCKGVSGLGDIDFSGIGEYRDSQGNIRIGPPAPGQEVTGVSAQQSAPGQPAQPQTEFGQKVNVITDAIAKLGAAFAPAFKKEPRPKVIVEKQPDYTTYAVIGGAVIVASVLAIAVGKSGRK